MKESLLSAFALVFFVHSLTSGASAEELPSWIWSSSEPKGEEKAHFRHAFEVPEDVVRAILIASGDNRIDVYLNGDRRGVKSEDWGAPLVEDVTDRIRTGSKNWIAARAENAGGIGGAFAMIEFTHGDGSKSRIVSGPEWLATATPEKDWTTPDYQPSDDRWQAASVIRKFGEAPWQSIGTDRLADLLDLRVPQATPVEDIRLPEGFQAELLYSVPKSDQGSWVAMCLDDKNRLIVSDQYGALYRLPIPEPGAVLSPGDIEKISVDIGGAQGLAHAFGSLYAVLNTGEHGGRGLYRITDSDGDDAYDKKELLRKFDEVGGEHGPHAVVLGPDGESLYIVIGNQTPVTEVDTSRVPRIWDEDLLLERPIGRGFMKGTLAPGGWIAKTDKDGKTWELIATGFRNQYDIAFDRNGQMFTYDADMEWDINTPWYRPTRVNHVISGAEFGWRNGGGKWPAWYPDSVGAVVDIGPGSPTGVVFGHGAKFPEKYQNAFYAADWSYGKLYAVHLERDGASFTATFEEFMSAQPLPLTDLVVNPQDGAMYVAIGGRRVQSGLYRVTYVGDEPTAPAEKASLTELQSLREKIEGFHREDAAAVDAVWEHLGHTDRYIRFAARVALEHQPVAQWKEKALALEEPEALMTAMMALARVSRGTPEVQPDILAALDRIGLDGLTRRQQRDLVRTYSLAFTRMGEGDSAARKALAERIATLVPSNDPALNAEALQLLVYLDHPEAAKIGLDLLAGAPSQEEQLSYAKSLRHQKSGWDRGMRKQFFEWFVRAKGYKGGPSFALFVQNMKDTALANTPEEDKVALKEVIEAEPPSEPVFAAEPRTFVKNWTVEDFDALINVGLEGNRDFVNGRKMFGAASCFACHRFGMEGGALGPDLTSVAGKFSPRDLLESIIEPSKEISDQYGQMIFTMKDGSVVMGRIMNLNGDNVTVNTNMMNPDETVGVDRKRMKSMEPSPVSMMPPGLVNTLSEDDVLDLLAYLLSKGNPEDPMFAE